MKLISVLPFLFLFSCYVKNKKINIKTSDIVEVKKEETFMFQDLPYDTTLEINNYRIVILKQYMFDSSVVLLNYMIFYNNQILEDTRVSDTLLDNYYSRIEYKEKSIRLVDLYGERDIFNWEISLLPKDEKYYKFLISEYCGACHELISDTLIIDRDTVYIDW